MGTKRVPRGYPRYMTPRAVSSAEPTPANDAAVASRAPSRSGARAFNRLLTREELDRLGEVGGGRLWQKRHRQHNSGLGEYLSNSRVLTVVTGVSRLLIAGVR